MKRLIVTGALCATPWIAAAHSGHGMSGAHWHATDAWGYAVLAAIAVAALWFARRK